jgi:hypothetical protein
MMHVSVFPAGISLDKTSQFATLHDIRVVLLIWQVRATTTPALPDPAGHPPQMSRIWGGTGKGRSKGSTIYAGMY